MVTRAEYRVWKGSNLVGKNIEAIENEYDIKIKGTHHGLYDSENPIQFDTIETGMLIIAEGEKEKLDILHKDAIPPI